MDPRIIEESLLSLSVRHNGLIIPGRSIMDFLAHYCTGLGVWTANESYPIYIPGSATLLKYRSRYFMVCTRHQLNHTPDFSDVCLMMPHTDGNTECITSGGARWIDGSNEGDHEQIVIFDFTEPCTDKPELKSMFFDFRQQHPNMRVDSIVAFITYGYPTDHTEADYENSQIRQVKKHVLGHLAAPGADDALHIIDTIVPLDFDPDGMSGGPTFCVVIDGIEGFGVHLAGVTVRGGKNRFMVIKAGAIQAMLDTVFKIGSQEGSVSAGTPSPLK